MAVSIKRRGGPEAIESLLEGIVGGELGPHLISMAEGENSDVTRDEVADAFQTACLRAKTSCTGHSEGEVFMWLLRTTHNELGRVRRRRKHEVAVRDVYAERDRVDELSVTPVDAVIKREQRTEFARLAAAVIDRLSERDRLIASLYSRDFSRVEIAAHLGVTPRAVKRAMERILLVGREALVEQAGEGCDAGRDVVARHAFRLASSGEAADAHLHLATCESCTALYERLDLWREQVAAMLLPLPPVIGAHVHVVERVVHAGTEALTVAPSRPAGPGGVRRHVADAVASVREHAAGLYYRAVDPTPLAGVRPGAAVAAVAGCLAIGGGATTYCLQQGSDPFTALARLGAPGNREHKPKPKRQRARAAQAPAPPVVTTPPPTTQQAPLPPPPPPIATPAPLPPAPEDEIEPTAPTGSSEPARTASAPRRQPAPAPADGPSEFEP